MRRLLPLLVATALLATFVVPSTASAQEIQAQARDGWWRGVVPRLYAEPPYRTQLDGSQFAGSNCGPAVLGMALDAYGIHHSTIDLRLFTHTYQGTWGRRGGTALEHMARVSEDLGIPTHGLYDVPDQEFHQWSVEDIAAQVEKGRMVVPLVRYGLLPGNEASGVRYGHYILLYATSGDGFMYQDPAVRPVENGRGRWISREQLDRAMAAPRPTRQAVAFGA